jgi:hypothetical protein
MITPALVRPVAARTPANVPGGAPAGVPSPGELRQLMARIETLTAELDAKLRASEAAALPEPAPEWQDAVQASAAASPRTDIAIVVPMSWDYEHKKFSVSLESLIRPEGLQVDIIRLNADTIYKMRHEGVKRARAMGAREVLFLDADMAFPKDTLVRLRSHGMDIVGGLCRQRRGPAFAACQWESALGGTWRFLEPHGDYPLRVAATGGACLLVQMSVFDEFERRWPGEWYFINRECLPDSPPVAGDCMSEDVWFCRRAKEAGFDIWVDQGLRIGHITTAVIYDAEDHTPTVLLEQGVQD